MDYRRFERLVLLLGGATIVASTLTTASEWTNWEPVLGQALLFGVFVSAVHWGRRAGFFAATIASLTYVIFHVAKGATTVQMNASTLFLLTAHVLAFGIVGIIGGEVCSRIKYTLAALAGESAIDEESGVYNQRYAIRVLDSARARLQRYGEPFSVLTAHLSDGLWAELPVARRRQFIRAVASHLRADVRLVDEVARFEDGSFIVILPHTAKGAGQIVADRVSATLRRVLGASERAVRIDCHGGLEDAAWMESALVLLKSGQVSDEYRSSDSSTVNPADLSTSNPRGSSTFNTSTAALPDGSTKQ